MFKTIIKNLYFLTFLNGFLLATLLYFKMEASYEGKLFAAIQATVDAKVERLGNDDSTVVQVMRACNALLRNRADIFGNRDLRGVKTDYFNPTTVDLMTARGACGSYSAVLARILENYNYPVRIAQMKANGIFAAHNVVEVKVKDGWVVLDPTFNVYFVKPGGKGLADFNDVKNNFAFYSKQLPADYDMNYRYEDVRYTNWHKVPVVMPAIKKVLDYTIGSQRANTISLHVHFLKIYDVFFYITLMVYIPVFLLIVMRILRNRVGKFSRFNFSIKSMPTQLESANTANA